MTSAAAEHEIERGCPDTLWELPEIASFFPLKFPGRKAWLEFVGRCNGCREAVLGIHLRGRVRRLNASTFEVRAHGYCDDCNLVTHFTYMLHDDMSVTGADATGRPARWLDGGEVGFQ